MSELHSHVCFDALATLQNVQNIEDIYCNYCGADHSTGDCPELCKGINFLNVPQIMDSVTDAASSLDVASRDHPPQQTLDHSRSSVPTGLHVIDDRQSNGSNGSAAAVAGAVGTCVITSQKFAKGSRFGPILAKKSCVAIERLRFPLVIFGNVGIPDDLDIPELSELFKVRNVYLDTTAVTECNWMVHVQPAAYRNEQNLIAYQQDGHIYFMSIVDIEVGDVLKVWYAPTYAAKMMVPLLQDSPHQIVNNVLHQLTLEQQQQQQQHSHHQLQQQQQHNHHQQQHHMQHNQIHLQQQQQQQPHQQHHHQHQHHHQQQQQQHQQLLNGEGNVSAEQIHSAVAGIATTVPYATVESIGGTPSNLQTYHQQQTQALNNTSGGSNNNNNNTNNGPVALPPIQSIIKSSYPKTDYANPSLSTGSTAAIQHQHQQQQQQQQQHHHHQQQQQHQHQQQHQLHQNQQQQHLQSNQQQHQQQLHQHIQQQSQHHLQHSAYHYQRQPHQQHPSSQIQQLQQLQQLQQQHHSLSASESYEPNSSLHHNQLYHQQQQTHQRPVIQHQQFHASAQLKPQSSSITSLTSSMPASAKKLTPANAAANAAVANQSGLVSPTSFDNGGQRPAATVTLVDDDDTGGGLGGGGGGVGGGRSGKKKVYHCEVCDKKYATMTNIYKHMRSHQLYLCSLCMRTFPQEHQIKEHKCPQGSVKTPQCHVCFKYLSNSWSLTRHMKIHVHELDESGNYIRQPDGNGDTAAMASNKQTPALGVAHAGPTTMQRPSIGGGGVNNANVGGTLLAAADSSSGVVRVHEVDISDVTSCSMATSACSSDMLAASGDLSMLSATDHSQDYGGGGSGAEMIGGAMHAGSIVMSAAHGAGLSGGMVGMDHSASMLLNDADTTSMDADESGIAGGDMADDSLENGVGVECLVCSKRFKSDFRLLKHQRQVHSARIKTPKIATPVTPNASASSASHPTVSKPKRTPPGSMFPQILAPPVTPDVAKALASKLNERNPNMHFQQQQQQQQQQLHQQQQQHLQQQHQQHMLQQPQYQQNQPHHQQQQQQQHFQLNHMQLNPQSRFAASGYSQQQMSQLPAQQPHQQQYNQQQQNHHQQHHPSMQAHSQHHVPHQQQNAADQMHLHSHESETNLATLQTSDRLQSASLESTMMSPAGSHGFPHQNGADDGFVAGTSAPSIDDGEAKSIGGGDNSSSGAAVEPFECDVCHKKFQKRNQLTKHRPIHDNTQFVCPYCPNAKSVKAKSTMQKHLRALHEDRIEEWKVPGFVNQLLATVDGKGAANSNASGDTNNNLDRMLALAAKRDRAGASTSMLQPSLKRARYAGIGGGDEDVSSSDEPNSSPMFGRQPAASSNGVGASGSGGSFVMFGTQNGVGNRTSNGNDAAGLPAKQQLLDRFHQTLDSLEIVDTPGSPTGLLQMVNGGAVAAGPLATGAAIGVGDSGMGSGSGSVGAMNGINGRVMLSGSGIWNGGSIVDGGAGGSMAMQNGGIGVGVVGEADGAYDNFYEDYMVL